MRRVHAICTFTQYNYVTEHGSIGTYYKINDLSVITSKHVVITLYNVNWDKTDSKHSYKYKYIGEMMQTVLNFLKNNDMYVKCYPQEHYCLYDITCIDTNTSTHHAFHMYK